MSSEGNWPAAGDKVIYKGAGFTWFRNILKNAEDNLAVGETYTLSSVNPLSSWCRVKLKETGDVVYSLSFFEYKSKNADTR